MVTALPMETLTVQPAVSGRLDILKGYNLEMDPRLTITGKNLYKSRELVPKDFRISTAAEELALQLAEEAAGKDPRQATVFDDLFARNEGQVYVFQWTETGLRVPKGTQPEYFQTDSNGSKYYPRIVLIGDKEVGEVLVPEGDGRVVTKWDKVFGLPAETESIKFPHTPYTTHFRFNSNPQKDPVSGQQDVAVGRRSNWPHFENERCLNVDSDYERWGAGSDGGFRLVRGSVQVIERRRISLEADAVQKALASVGSG
ncbi:MAG: hypothetical protein HY362_00295 [Candidatus Aenigmarchaeota archaeon]|nr:hypothetical protein [Candidatus Aenigmarchaeota archaeon]